VDGQESFYWLGLSISIRPLKNAPSPIVMRPVPGHPRQGSHPFGLCNDRHVAHLTASSAFAAAVEPYNRTSDDQDAANSPDRWLQ
jgi:hypothetical protein